MAGINQELLPKRLHDFSNVLGGQSQDVVIAKAVPIFQWREVLLVARLHDRNGVAWAAGQTIAVRLSAEAHTDEDPNTDFLFSPDLGSVTFNSGSAAPSMLVSAASFRSAFSNYGGYMRVVITCTQAGMAATFQANLSIDLSLKA